MKTKPILLLGGILMLAANTAFANELAPSVTINNAETETLANRDKELSNLLSDIQRTLNNDIKVTTLDPVESIDAEAEEAADGILDYSLNNSTSSSFEFQSSSVNSATSMDDINKYGYNEEYAEYSIGIEISAEAKTMRSARIYSIDEASKYAVTEFLKSLNQSNNTQLLESIKEKHLDRVLIVDESYDTLTGEYIGYFDVWIDIEGATKLALGFNPSETELTIEGPEWVLIVPSIEDSNGVWRLADRNGVWTDQWKVPSTEYNTQFVLTRGDSDDRAAINNVNSIDEYALFLSNKYNASSILFASYETSDNTVTSLFWDRETGILYRRESSNLTQNEDYASAKETALSLFWNMFSDEVDYPENDNYANQGNDSYESNQVVETEVIKYLIVGQPRFAESGAMVNLQIIVPPSMTWDDIEYSFRRVPDFNIVSFEKGNNSILARVFINGVGSQIGVETFLADIGFTRF